MSHYAVVARWTDELNTPQHLSEQVGMTAAEWAQAPLTHWLPVMTEVTPQALGNDLVRLRWRSPLAGRAVVQWGNTEGVRRQLFEVQVGVNSMEFNMSGCQHGCQASTTVVMPVQPSVSIPVPTSLMLDPTLPRAVQLDTVDLPWTAPNTTLPLSLAHPLEVMPGETVNVEVTMPGEGEVTVWVVDKAILDLLPHPLPATFSVELPDKLPWLRSTFRTLYSSLTNSQFSEEAFQEVFRRMAADPWLSQYLSSWSTQPGQQLDRVTEEFLRCQFNRLTDFPFPDPRYTNPLRDTCTGGPISMFNRNFGDTPVSAPMEAEIAADGGGNGAKDGNSGNSAPSLRTNFASTALFRTLKVNSSGQALLSFTAPDNIGTWVVRAVGVSRSSGRLGYGRQESEFVAVRPISLIASMPRVVRVGDVFTAGCTITPTRDDNILVALVVEGQALRLTGQPNITISVASNQPVELVFELECLAVGQSQVKFYAYSQGNLADAFQHELPSRGLQEPVFVATSFAIPANTAAIEGTDFPAALPGSGTVSLVVGVGRFPTVLAVGQSIIAQHTQQMTERGWDYTERLLALLPISGIYGVYQVPNDTAVAQAAASVQLAALETLRERTHGQYGLQSLPRRLIRNYYRSLDTNTHALFIWSQLHALNPSSDAPFRSPTHLSMWNAWHSAVWNELSDRYKRPLAFRWDQLASVYLALGAAATPPATLPVAEQQFFSFESLVAHRQHLSTSGQTMLSITLATQIPRRTSVLRSLTTSLYNSLRVQGRTAYLSTSGGRSAESMAVNTLGLWALLASEFYPNDPLLEKLANYVTEGDKGYWFNSRTATYRLLALTDYDRRKGSTSPDLQVNITARQEALLALTFNTSGQLPVQSQMPWERFGNGSALPVFRFTAIGQGEASVVLGLHFTPAVVFKNPVYFGIYVEKVILRMTGLNSGVVYNGTGALTPGQTVTVVLQISTPDALRDVVVVDPLASCLEAVDPLVTAPPPPSPPRSTEVRTAEVGIAPGGITPVDVAPSSEFDLNTPPTSWSFPKMEVRKDQVTCFAPYLSAGTHTCTYIAVVVTSGAFQLPPTKAFVTQQPEVMGLSNTHQLIVDPVSTTL
eukprot:NODE_30_length_4134_cov_39.066883_g27_i0.p1 GENE.NODE_30_length_4134_cov_39.066883_g27_i0~~NODE_30_length_4134_cov_39.066883_g27_i0.p1  ORF type:complete len:1101 (-),score=242.70 NODE_30_length_4134_cov_39.066883_g27_i0:239-3541(-)